MGYEDFVWFIMSEEDKGSDMALDYWFKCCDLDGDGCLRANEMLVSSCIQTFVVCFGTSIKPQLHNSCMYKQYHDVRCQCVKMMRTAACIMLQPALCDRNTTEAREASACCYYD